MTITLIGLVVGGVAGYAYGDGGFLGSFLAGIGGGGGAIVAAFVAGIVTASDSRLPAPPPQVSLAPGSRPQPNHVQVNVQTTSSPSLEQRLESLNGLQAKGLITSEEYQDRRKKLLEQI